jgi:curli production assembly/transport component CsgE
MRSAIAAALSLTVLCCPGGASAAVSDEAPLDVGRLEEPGGRNLEQTTGYIVDRSVTNFGAQFVRTFAEAWRACGGVGGVDLTVVEKPSARWGSTLFVESNNRQLVRILLQAGRSADLKPLARQTAQYLQEKLADDALERALNREDDLGREELP